MKYPFTKIISILTLWCCIVHSGFSQDNGLGNTVGYMNHLGMFQQAYPQEKVHLHFDNTGYFKGEKMLIFMKMAMTCPLLKKEKLNI